MKALTLTQPWAFLVARELKRIETRSWGTGGIAGAIHAEVSDDRVYECGECGTKGAGSDARQCEQCHKFAGKISDTSCPECEAPMDDAETVQAQRATNGELVKCD